MPEVRQITNTASPAGVTPAQRTAKDGEAFRAALQQAQGGVQDRKSVV